MGKVKLKVLAEFCGISKPVLYKNEDLYKGKLFIYAGELFVTLKDAREISKSIKRGENNG